MIEPTNLPATTLPTASPAEVIAISPEALEVANCYLQFQNAAQVAEELQLPSDQVTQILSRREVRAYIDHVFFDMGFNNRFRLRSLMDTIIAKKLEEMDEAGVSTSKDILEILALSHKMTMEAYDKEIALRKLDQSNVKTQTNIQINDQSVSEGSRYGSLLEKLLTGQMQQKVE